MVVVATIGLYYALFLERSIVQADEQTDNATDLNTVVPAQNVVANRGDRLLGERTPAQRLREDGVLGCRVHVVGAVVSAVGQDGRRDVEGKRVDGVLVPRRLVLRVGAQGEVEEVREEEWERPVGYGPQRCGSPPAGAGKLGEVGDADLERPAGRGRGVCEVVCVGQGIPLEGCGFGDEDEGLDGAHGAGGLAQPFLPLVDVRPVPELGGLLLDNLEGLVGNLSELCGRGRDVDLCDARGGNVRGSDLGSDLGGDLMDALSNASHGRSDLTRGTCKSTRNGSWLVRCARELWRA